MDTCFIPLKSKTCRMFPSSRVRLLSVGAHSECELTTARSRRENRLEACLLCEGASRRFQTVNGREVRYDNICNGDNTSSEMPHSSSERATICFSKQSRKLSSFLDYSERVKSSEPIPSP